MGIFDKIFWNAKEEDNAPSIKFGRYSDSYKEKEKYKDWDRSIELFENGEFLGSLRLFFDYLKEDGVDNVSYTESDGTIDFELYQGSKKVVGRADKHSFWAEAKIAKTSTLEIGFLRRLMEENFGLKYSRYALDEDDNLTMVYHSFAHDGSPYKNYYGLKELATSADKQDDIIVEEFDSLDNINTGHTEDTPDHIKEIKYNYLISRIEAAIKEVNEGKLNIDQYPGGIAYLLLEIVYKCDYLLKPEGYTMKQFEEIHKIYFQKDGKSPQYKNREIIKIFKKILERKKEDFFQEWYDVKATFGVTAPTAHANLANFIDNELNNLDWYKNNKHDAVAQAVPNYIVGYYLFNYAVPAIDRSLLHLYYEVVEHEFMKEVGIDKGYINKGKLSQSAIKNKISSILKRYKSIYPSIKPQYAVLKYDSLVSFSKSYLVFIRHLNLAKVEA